VLIAQLHSFQIAVNRHGDAHRLVVTLPCDPESNPGGLAAINAATPLLAFVFLVALGVYHNIFLEPADGATRGAGQDSVGGVAGTATERPATGRRMMPRARGGEDV
jgi:hypothetical protein